MHTLGQQARAFHTPHAVLAAWAEEPACTLLITDVRMPEMDGPELIEQLRAAGFHGSVVVVSNYSERDVALPSGSLFLRKPPGVRALRDALSQLTRQATRGLALALALGAALFELIPPPAHAAPPMGAVYVWQGFEQAWTYNHRINRLGDWAAPLVCDDNGRCTVTLSHAAASGSGSDTASWSSYGSVWMAPGLRAQAGTLPLALRALDGEGTQLGAVAKDCSVLPAAPQAALLAGFEIASLGDAERLQSLTIQVNGPDHPEAPGCVSAVVVAEVDCRSPECDLRQRRAVDLALRVHYQLLDAPGLQRAEGVASRAWEWPDRAWLRPWRGDDGAPLPPSLQTTALPLPAPALPGPALVGVTGLSVLLDRDHHMVALAAALLPSAPLELRGAESVSQAAKLGFQQWNEEGSQRWSTYASPGDGVVSLRTLTLQAPNACLLPMSISGEIAYTADGHGIAGGLESQVGVETRAMILQPVPECSDTRTGGG